MNNIPPIITDPTDCDVYKWSMGNFLFKKGYLREIVGWQFFSRGDWKFPLGFGRALQEQVDSWADLRFTDEAISYIEKSMYWLDYFYINSYLKTYRFTPELVKINVIGHGTYEDISVSYEGEWGQVIFFEIYLLATMSELYNIMTDMDAKRISDKVADERTIDKLKRLSDCGAKVAEFGTRRRYSKQMHRRVLELMIKHAPDVLLGTSNAMFSREYSLTPMGTIAHELIMFMAAKFNPAIANELVMKQWVEVYNGALGIYLTDTYTTKHFLKYFDLLHSKLWDGVREDSAPDTDKYVDMIIEHYKKLRIDPTSKTINHSNRIGSVERIVHMQNYRKDEIRRVFGLGTWLTNDVYPENSELKAVDWVAKMVYAYVDGHKKYCVKLSDIPDKITSIDPATTEHYLQELYLK
ncbi:nicotinate phosphoribosyltransferase [Deferribacterales bacterium RsTz2092]|nr:nicotinate phosphoribosyltransferase [Deferribacterales bacterium]